MSTAATTAEEASASQGLSAGLTVACAVTCGAMVANLYYAQPLIDLIAPELRLSENISGLIVTLTQLGYGAGLLLIVSLADRVENRRLILTTLICAAAALAGIALPHPHRSSSRRRWRWASARLAPRWSFRSPHLWRQKNGADAPSET